MVNRIPSDYKIKQINTCVPPIMWINMCVPLITWINMCFPNHVDKHVCSPNHMVKHVCSPNHVAKHVCSPNHRKPRVTRLRARTVAYTGTSSANIEANPELLICVLITAPRCRKDESHGLREPVCSLA